MFISMGEGGGGLLLELKRFHISHQAVCSGNRTKDQTEWPLASINGVTRGKHRSRSI